MTELNNYKDALMKASALYAALNNIGSAAPYFEEALGDLIRELEARIEVFEVYYLACELNALSLKMEDMLSDGIGRHDEFTDIEQVVSQLTTETQSVIDSTRMAESSLGDKIQAPTAEQPA